MRFLNDSVLNAANAATNQTSAAIDSSFMVAVSLIVTTTGTAAGDIKLQASNDVNNPTNFVDIPSATVAISGAGTVIIAKLDVAYQYIRAVYTVTSGTGTITTRLKSVGF